MDKSLENTIKTQPLFVTNNVFQLLYSFYNPNIDITPNGFLIAGSENKGLWFSNLGVGDQTLSNFVLNEEYYEPIIEYSKNNKDKVRLIPWFQYNNKRFNDNFQSFLETNIFNFFNDFIVLKPTENPLKRNFVIDYYQIENKNFLKSNIEVTQLNYKHANQYISKFLDFWICHAKNSKMKKYDISNMTPN